MDRQMKKIDLHVHTTFSDGTYEPEEMVALAAQRGLAAVAVTDHDNAGGFTRAKAAGEKYGVEVVPGIEISTKYGCSVHILGYYIDPESEAAKKVLNWIIEDRDARNEKMCRLMADDGLDVTYEDMKRRFGPCIGRPHFAEVLVDMGLAESINDAFDKYVEKGRKYYQSRHFLTIDQSIQLILDAGGVPVLAHPYQYPISEAELREMIEHCIKAGLKGMECRYSLYNEEQSMRLEAMAEEYGLIKTGGSDFHGAHKPHIGLGTGTEKTPLNVPYEWLEILKQYRRESN